jgi:hypothetical protein
MKAEDFGPNTAAILEFKERLGAAPWFSRIETSCSDEERVERVKLEFLLDHPVAPWGDAVIDAENKIERHVMDSGRLAQQHRLQNWFVEPWSSAQVSKVMDVLLERYPEYYKDTFSYAYERIEFPERFVRYAYFELLVDDKLPRVTFFRDQLPWFEKGFWPCGWKGHYPEGRLILL